MNWDKVFEEARKRRDAESFRHYREAGCQFCGADAPLNLDWACKPCNDRMVKIQVLVEVG